MPLPKPPGLDERLQALPTAPPRLEELAQQWADRAGLTVEELVRRELAGDQCVTLHGISWELYCALDAARGESASPRLTYCDGVLEIMNPGKAHEGVKTRIGRLVETYCDERNIDIEGFGSWTLRAEAIKRGAEPDECYVVGSAERVTTATVPDFVIEVVETRGGVLKLDVYRGLGVPEVWFYQNGQMSVYVLAEGFYLKGRESVALPGLDFGLIERCVKLSTSREALRMLRAALRGGTP